MTDREILDLTSLKATLHQFADERDWHQFHTPKNLVASISIEAAELLEHFQWLTPDESIMLKTDSDKVADVADELADVLIYALMLADKLGIDLNTSILGKIEKNRAKYPE